MNIIEQIFGLTQGADPVQKRRMFGALNRLQDDQTPGAIMQRAMGGGDMSAPEQPAGLDLGGSQQQQAAAPPQSAPQAGSGYTVDRLGAFADGYSSGGLIGAIANATGGANRQEGAVNETFQFLVRKGLPEADARAVVQNPQLMQQVLPRLIGPKSDDRKYMQVNGRIVEIGPDGAKELYAAPDGGRESVKYGTTPYFTQDGKPYVTGTDGSIKFPEFPEDAKPLAPGQLAENKARGSATGKAMGEAKAALPKVLQSTAETLGALDALESDPYLDNMLGSFDGRTPDITSDANRVKARMDEITGKTFLTAFQSLRGGGAITEAEGVKATAAISRLGNRVQDPTAYRAAIQDIKDIAKNGLLRAKVDAGELPPEALSGMRDFELVQDTGTGKVTAAPTAEPQGAPAPAPSPQYREEIPLQGTNPRAPGYRPGASTQAPNNFNPRAPGYTPQVRTLDAGDGFKVRVK